MSRSLSSSPLVIPLIVALALFMEFLDSSIIATALPAIAKDLGTEPQRLSLAFTAYMISMAVFVPLSGWVADRLGTKTVFRAALGLFVVSSIACGSADSLGALIIARLFQGMSGAMMAPVGRLIVVSNTPKADLINALTWVALPALVAPMIGPLVGGWIVTHFSWRWIFLINVPIGLVGMALVSVYFTNQRADEKKPFDFLGFVLLGLGLAGTVLGVELAGHGLAPQAIALGILGLGVASLLLFVPYARRREHPVIDLRLFRTPTFDIAITGGMMFRMSTSSLSFLLPLMFQTGFGLSPVVSGLLILGNALGSVIIKPFTNRALRLWGFRRMMIGNTFICALLLAGCALFKPDTPLGVIFAFLMIGGFCRSMHFTGINGLAYADVTEKDMSNATTISGIAQQLSFSLGIAVAALALSMTLTVTGHKVLGPTDFWPALCLMAGMALVPLIWNLRLSAKDGAEVSGHEPAFQKE